MGDPWKVYLVDPGVVNMTQGSCAGLEGACIFPLAIILIDKNLANARKPAVAMHEVLHAIHWATGLEKQGILKDKDTGKVEEALVSLVAPVIFDSLNRSGFFKFPPIPHGW